MNIIITLLSLVFLVLTCFYGCDTFGREYHEDIVYELQDIVDVTIIKEWKFLQGSEADDGFCPFAERLYEITQTERSICPRNRWYNYLENHID